ncbi:MAG: HD domain-containing protein [Spirochaetaceae bacterium]|nr:MAG: HD domain-containing protein [Spirochaetaceae bacterium]
MTEHQKILHHLDSDYTEPIRDPIWKHIYLSDALVRLVSTQKFQELNDIKQLGPAYLVYPGATHTRFAHSLGSFHLASRIIRGLLQGDEKTVFTLEGVKAFLAAALLHDLGHYPYAHALKNLGVRDHEQLTAEIVLEQPVAGILSKEVGIPAGLVAAIVDTHRDAADFPEALYFRKLLSGVLDPDKLDYLNRDAYYCGVPYGIQDVDFFLSGIVFHEKNGFALAPKGLTAVENILFSKYLMYRTVYWHKTVRIATAMIKKALYLACEEGMLSRNELYGLTDITFLDMVAGKSYPPLTLVAEVGKRRLCKQAAKAAYDQNNPLHIKLGNLSECRKKEAEIARELQRRTGKPVAEYDVIIDLPEHINFETDLPIVSPAGDVAFTSSMTIFSKSAVAQLDQSLRQVSLCVRNDEDIVRAAEKISLETGWLFT